MRDFLSKIPGFRKAPAPALPVTVRRAHQPTARKEPIAESAEASSPAPAVHAAPVEQAPAIAHVPHETAVDIQSEKDVPEWRAIVADVVRERDEPSCVVLDLTFRSVLVLGTPSFFGSGAHSALLSTLSTKTLSLDSEKTTTKEVIAAVRARAQRSIQSLSPRVDGGEAANIQLYKDLVSGAFNMGGSDIHIELDAEARSTVRVRVDGKAYTWRTFDTPVLNAALAAAYASLTIPGTNSNADWTLERPINTITRFFDGTANTNLNCRLTTQPITGGNKITIRVSDGNSDTIGKQTLYDSGFTAEQIQQQILPALMREKGFILVGGSTGAGKTVTLQRMVMSIPGREWKVIAAIEDPNEARIPGVAHTSLQRSTDDSPEKVKVMFDSAFLTQMRQDPDILMIGEARDRTSADLATDAVLTGHLLMITMHGNSAVGQLFRLMNDRIGMAADVLADEDNFALSMAQYLVPRLCQKCKVPAVDVLPERDASLLRTRWSLDTSKMFCANTKGCEHCARKELPGNGQKGRIVSAEIITQPTEEFLQCLLKGDKKGAELAWRRTRRAGFDSPDMWGKTSFENALYHVSQGMVSPLALSEVFGKSLEEFKVVETTERADVVHLATERAA